MVTILLRYGGKSFEGIESDDFAMMVKWLVYATQVIQQNQVFAPTHTEFDYNAMMMENMIAIQIVEEQNLREILPFQKQGAARYNFFIRYWTIAKELSCGLSRFNLVFGRLSKGIYVWLHAQIFRTKVL
jgi:hypothetical protein